MKRSIQKIKKGVVNTTKKVKEFADKVINGRDALGPNVVALLKKYGDLPVIGIVIGRHPLAGMLVTAIDTVSAFQFKKNIANSPYDKLFHLFLKITLQGGALFNLEKTEVISLSENPKSDSTDELMPVAVVPENLTLNKMLENCQQRMGNNFYTYASSNNNCQDFCLALLQSNYMNEPEYIDFVKQNTVELFENTGVLNDVANTVTGLAGRFDVIRRGGEMHHARRVALHYHRKENDFNNATKKVFHMMSISGKYNVIGSANNTNILYNSDYDIETHTDGNLKNICEKFKQIFKDAKENNDVFITDFKCGAVGEEPLRWSYDDIQRGYKKVVGHKITFIEALEMKEMIKLDMIVLVNGVFCEFSDNYYFRVNGKELYDRITAKGILEGLEKKAKEYYNDGMYYKYLKRVYSISVMKNKNKLVNLLTEYFNSIVGLCYKCVSDLEVLEILLACKFRKVEMSDIHSNLQIIKQKLSSCREIEHKSFSDKIDKICDIDDAKKVSKEINKIVKYLKEIINLNAKNKLSELKINI